MRRCEVQPRQHEADLFCGWLTCAFQVSLLCYHPRDGRLPGGFRCESTHLVEESIHGNRGNLGHLGNLGTWEFRKHAEEIASMGIWEIWESHLGESIHG